MFRLKKSKDDLELLEKKYEEQLKNNPASNSFILLAEVLLKRNRIDKAISTLSRGLRKNKNSITARFLLGKAYFQSWNIDLAIKELQKVISLAPDHFSASELLIEIKKSEKKYDEALKIAKNLSFYYRGNSELQKITDELLLLIDKSDNDIVANNSEKALGDKKGVSEKSFPRTETLADIYISQRQYAKALDILTELVLRYPKNVSYQDKYNKVVHLLSRISIR